MKTKKTDLPKLEANDYFLMGRLVKSLGGKRRSPEFATKAINRICKGWDDKKIIASLDRLSKYGFISYGVSK